MTLHGRLALSVATALAVCVPLLPFAGPGAVAFPAAATCTIVGTPGPDHLVGTRRADVICGRGGNDTVIGRGGADVVRAGGGADAVQGGAGKDQIAGGNGRDLVTGGSGDDELDGGDGDDDLTGDGGEDELDGDTGDDFLDGGTETDDLDGGEGANTCVVGGADLAVRCVYDLEVPRAVGVLPSATTIDVSEDDASVTARVHATDDTGVTWVDVHLVVPGTRVSYAAAGPATLVEGTARDGWWETAVTLPRYALAGDYRFVASVKDRMLRFSDDTTLDVPITVTAATPDVQGPTLVGLAEPAPGTVVDVRTAPGGLTVTAHLTDDLSGIVYAVVCARPATLYIPSPYCEPLTLSSGTVLDGTWAATLTIPQGALGDDWKLNIDLHDRANPWRWERYHSYLEPSHGGAYRLIPDSRGVFEVVGSDPTAPETPPTLMSLALTPTEVDTLTGPATISVVAGADDPDGVVRHARITLVKADDPYLMHDASLIRQSDGLWRGSLVLPQGTSPGDYVVYVVLQGATRGYVFYPDNVVTVVDRLEG